MKTLINIFCFLIPFPSVRRPLRATLVQKLIKRQSKFISGKHYSKIIKKSKLFDAGYYTKQYAKFLNGCADPLEHYMTKGYKLGYNPSADFDNDFYLYSYPDIRIADVNPLQHYIIHGKREGRRISKVIPDIDYLSIDIKPNTVLLISHEFSLTGAPIALQKLAQILQKNNRNFLILSPKHGDLEHELDKLKIPYIVDENFMKNLCKQKQDLQKFLNKFSTIFFNTIVTLEFAKYINTNNKKICWVHEGSFGYDCESALIDIKSAFEHMDAVYSVGSWSKGFTDKYVPSEKSNTFLYGIEEIKKTNNIKKNKKINFGLFGLCCDRKGQHLLVDAIKKLPSNIKKNCHFTFVGKINKTPYCKQLLKSVSGLTNVTFTGQLSHDDTVSKMAEMDIIVCPSLDDPMPIVCTEAAVLGVPVIVSDQTGTCEFVDDGVNGYIYHMGQDDLSDIIQSAYRNRDNLPNMGKLWRMVYDKNFNMDIFEQNINSIFFCVRHKMSVFMNNNKSCDIPYFEMMTENFQKAISINTGNNLINGFGIKQFDYDFVDNLDAENITVFAANTLRPNCKLSTKLWDNLLTDTTKNLNILGLGTQATLEEMNPASYIKTLPDEMMTWITKISKRVKSIGVRGEFTGNVLKELGINNYDVIGCPSWFVNGYNQPTITKKKFSKDLKVAFATCWEPYTEWHVQWHRALLNQMLMFPDPKFIIQSEFDFLPYMIANKNQLQSKLYISNEQLQQSIECIKKHFSLSDLEILQNEKIMNMFEIFSSIDTWAEFVKTRDVYFGFRIHGCIMAIKNGVPAICIVSDSRTYELCELFKIPYIRVDQLQSKDLDFEKIYNEADFSKLNAEYPVLLKKYINYLEKNNIKHKL